MSVIQRVGEKDVVLIDKLVAPSQEELIMFTRALRTALLSYNLYPPGHAITRRRLGEFIQQLMPLFRGAEVLVIGCKRDAFEVNDTQILQNVPEREVARELASFFELRGLRNIVVHRDVTLEEIEEVMTRWVQKTGDSRSMQTAWQKGLEVPHLRFNMTMANRSEMVINDGISERPLEVSQEALREAVMQVPVDALSASPDHLPVVQGGAIVEDGGGLVRGQVRPRQVTASRQNLPQGRAYPPRSAATTSQWIDEGPRHQATPAHAQRGAYSTQERAWQQQQQQAGRPSRAHTTGAVEARGYGGVAGRAPHAGAQAGYTGAQGYAGGPDPHKPNPAAGRMPQSRQGRVADAFSTGQFSPAMQAQLQAQAQQAQQQPYSPSGQMASPGPHQRGADGFATGQHRPYTPGGPAQAPGPQEQGPSFQPFNPFSSSDLPAGAAGAGNRGADVFSTGQFSPAMQAQLQAQAPSGMFAEPGGSSPSMSTQAPAAAPSGFKRIAIDPASFDHSPPPFKKLDYRQIDPVTLFSSKRFQEFLKRGGIGHYLSVYVPRDGAVEHHLGGGVVGKQSWMRSDAAQDLIRAVEALPDTRLQQGILTQLAHKISAGPTGLIEEQLQQLGSSRAERFLSQEILGRIPHSRVAELGQRTLRNMVRANTPQEFDHSSSTLQTLVDMQRKRNDWTPLIATLESLKRLKWDNRTEPWIRDKATQMLGRLVDPRTGQQLLYQALCGERVLQEQARYGLVAMGVDSAPIFIESLKQLQRRKDLESMYALIHDVSSQLATQQRRLFFGRLWAERAPLGQHQKIVLLKSMQQMAPETLEKFLLKELRFSEEQGNEDALLTTIRHVILFHTPGLRQIMVDFLRKRRFALYQEIEENILKILDHHQTIEGVSLLDDMIHNLQMDMALRASAVWLLGSLKRPQALALLEKVITERKRFWRTPRYAKELRLQALDTLRHFQWQGISSLLERALKDPDKEIKAFADQMLMEDRGFAIVE